MPKLITEPQEVFHNTSIESLLKLVDKYNKLAEQSDKEYEYWKDFNLEFAYLKLGAKSAYSRTANDILSLIS